MVDGIVLMKNISDLSVCVEQFRNGATKLLSTMVANDEVLIMIECSDVLRVEYNHEVAFYRLNRSETRGVYFDSDETPSFSLHIVDMTVGPGALRNRMMFVTYFMPNQVCP
jgi:hypothetical protein